MEQDEQKQWIVVTNNKHKHKGKITNKTIHNKSSQKTYQNELKEEYIQKFISSFSYSSNKKILQDVLFKIMSKKENKNQHIYIECLGLGNFLDSKKSYFQLLFLTKLVLPLINQKRANYICQSNQSEVIQINMYDPAFSEKEKKYINQLKMTQNQDFCFKKNSLNIYYMPHCQRFLYQKVLQKFKEFKKAHEKLGFKAHLLIIGNSIKQYIKRCELMKQKIPQIFQNINMNEQLKQIKIHDIEQAFNDTFIIYDQK